MRIVFFGTPGFAAYSLEALVESGLDVVGVVTAPDRPAGRGQKVQISAVKESALRLNLPLAQPEKLKSDEFAAQLRSWNPDLSVVIAFRMLPESVWNFPPLGTINLHASLLPDYRGAAPIQHALIQGETETGVTTFRLVHEIDAGDLLKQARLPIAPEETGGSLHDKLMVLGAEVMLDTLRELSEHRSVPQPQGPATDKLAPKLNRDFCELHPDREDALTCERKIRALAPYPGAWVSTPVGDVKIWACFKPMDAPLGNLLPGLNVEGKTLFLNCRQGRLQILSLQLPGKARISAIDYINGRKIE
ncbi:MAG: methionyl-tRNA formyltransferase [Bacteroidia bacterium]